MTAPSFTDFVEPLRVTKWWVVKQKSTGFYLPIIRGSSATSAEFTDKFQPRLFFKKHLAISALNHWLKGVAHIPSDSRYRDYHYNPREAVILPRNVDSADYEIVCVVLQELR
jgi:hypothetical protein